MFRKVKETYPTVGKQLCAVFVDGTLKTYDMEPLILADRAFTSLADDDLFFSVVVDAGGYGISWGDEVDLSSDELWEHGQTVKTPFDNLMALSTAAGIWEMDDSTLRKAL